MLRYHSDLKELRAQLSETGYILKENVDDEKTIIFQIPDHKYNDQIPILTYEQLESWYQRTREKIAPKVKKRPLRPQPQPDPLSHPQPQPKSQPKLQPQPQPQLHPQPPRLHPPPPPPPTPPPPPSPSPPPKAQSEPTAQQQPKPHPKPQPISQPKAQPQPQQQSRPQPQPKAQPQPKVPPLVIALPKPQAQPTLQPQLQPKVQVQPRPQPQPQLQVQPKPQPKPQTQVHSQPPQPQPQPSEPLSEKAKLLGWDIEDEFAIFDDEDDEAYCNTTIQHNLKKIKSDPPPPKPQVKQKTNRPPKSPTPELKPAKRSPSPIPEQVPQQPVKVVEPNWSDTNDHLERNQLTVVYRDLAHFKDLISQNDLSICIIKNMIMKCIQEDETNLLNDSLILLFDGKIVLNPEFWTELIQRLKRKLDCHTKVFKTNLDPVKVTENYKRTMVLINDYCKTLNPTLNLPYSSMYFLMKFRFNLEQPPDIQRRITVYPNGGGNPIFNIKVKKQLVKSAGFPLLVRKAN